MLINPKLDSDILDMALFGTTFMSGFLMMVISWSILVFNIKKSTRLPEEKVLFSSVE